MTGPLSGNDRDTGVGHWHGVVPGSEYEDVGERFGIKVVLFEEGLPGVGDSIPVKEAAAVFQRKTVKCVSHAACRFLGC